MRTALIDPKLLLDLTRRRIDINELVQLLEVRGAFSEDDEKQLVQEHRRKIVRRAVKQIKDSDGFPLIFSLVELDREGREIRKYKQESLFNAEDYKQAIEYCRQNKRYWSKIEGRLLKNAKTKFGEESTLFG